ncbi:hypothetical protein NCCP691_24500 [Noviherbaspirillum aridicola]|uniref:Uncharacterized protein n=1 Tax=Noviherbaspirillum aridicola TaxID=2849687 RepID=A0ABQ4Q5Y9_9BURK|nr:hypothetical protein NCCP691_24500 [Noviherbaspirillum aridicola]
MHAAPSIFIFPAGPEATRRRRTLLKRRKQPQDLRIFSTTEDNFRFGYPDYPGIADAIAELHCMAIDHCFPASGSNDDGLQDGDGGHRRRVIGGGLAGDRGWRTGGVQQHLGVRG